MFLWPLSHEVRSVYDRLSAWRPHYGNAFVGGIDAATRQASGNSIYQQIGLQKLKRPGIEFLPSAWK